MNEKFKDVFQRIVAETGIKTMTELGKVVGSSQQYVSKKSKEGEFPPAWAFKIAEKFGLSTDWLITGKGAKKRGARHTYQSVTDRGKRMAQRGRER